MHQRPHETPPPRHDHVSPWDPAPRSPLVWLLPVLPLVAAVLLAASWVIPSAATGATAPNPANGSLGAPTDFFRAAFPTASVTAEPDWRPGRVAPADEMAETHDLLVRSYVLSPRQAAPAPAVSEPIAGPTPAPAPTVGPRPTPTPVSTPTPAPTATPVAGPPLAASTAGLSPRESLLLVAMNDARAAAGLPAVVPRADLTEVARARSEEMIRLDYFAHFHPEGHSAYELLASAGITFAAAGENLVKTFGDVQHSVDIGFQALWDSPTHQANILKATYTRVGVGSYTSDDGTTIITTIFTDR